MILADFVVFLLYSLLYVPVLPSNLIDSLIISTRATK